MLAYVLYVGAALYLGILTSISPCPLATNIAAVSYIGRKVEHPRAVIYAGLLYTFGRCLLYLGLATLLTTTAMSIPAVSVFLQKYMHLVLGPVFMLLGMFLVGLITISTGGTMMSEGMQKRVDSMGIWGALLLGILFAISFCPTSATWFFGLLALTMGSEAGAITTVLDKVGIVLPAAGGFAGHVTSGHWDWRASLLLAIAVFAGGQIGSRISVGLDKKKLKKGFGWFLLSIALMMFLRLWLADAVPSLSPLRIARIKAGAKPSAQSQHDSAEILASNMQHRTLRPHCMLECRAIGWCSHGALLPNHSLPRWATCRVSPASRHLWHGAGLFNSPTGNHRPHVARKGKPILRKRDTAGIETVTLSP